MAVEEDDLLESVVGQAPTHVNVGFDEVLPIDIDGAGKIHDMGVIQVRCSKVAGGTADA